MIPSELILEARMIPSKYYTVRFTLFDDTKRTYIVSGINESNALLTATRQLEKENGGNVLVQEYSVTRK